MYDRENDRVYDRMYGRETLANVALKSRLWEWLERYADHTAGYDGVFGGLATESRLRYP